MVVLLVRGALVEGFYITRGHNDLVNHVRSGCVVGDLHLRRVNVLGPLRHRDPLRAGTSRLLALLGVADLELT